MKGCSDEEAIKTAFSKYGEVIDRSNPDMAEPEMIYGYMSTRTLICPDRACVRARVCVCARVWEGGGGGL